MIASGTAPRLVLVANLRARGLRLDPDRRRRLASICHGRATLLETSSVDEAAAALRSLGLGPADTCVFAGGDGTFMAGLSALHRDRMAHDWPAVGLLPVGTVGTVAKNLGVAGVPEHVLEDWIVLGESRRPPRSIQHATLALRATRDGETNEHVGFIFGTGLVARFFDVYEERGSGGLPLAAQIVARVFAESFTGGPFARRILEPMPAELVIEGAIERAQAWSLLCASVVDDLGLGMRLTYRGSERADRMHLVASSLAARELGPRMPFVLAGRSIGGRGHVDRLVDAFEVRFPDHRGSFVLDGDSFRAEEVQVRMGPTIRILLPG